MPSLVQQVCRAKEPLPSAGGGAHRQRAYCDLQLFVEMEERESKTKTGNLSLVQVLP